MKYHTPAAMTTTNSRPRTSGSALRRGFGSIRISDMSLNRALLDDDVAAAHADAHFLVRTVQHRLVRALDRLALARDLRLARDLCLAHVVDGLHHVRRTILERPRP